MASDVLCPRCLSLNPADAAACRQCGAPLTPGNVRPPGSPWQTLQLAALWLLFGPGILLPLLLFSPAFLQGPGATLRLAGGAVYVVASTAVLIWATVRYFRRG